jgi:hypothetical protein
MQTGALFLPDDSNGQQIVRSIPYGMQKPQINKRKILKTVGKQILSMDRSIKTVGAPEMSVLSVLFW